MSELLKCKICGKEYDACRTKRSASVSYRWFDVACCEEHGAEYLRQILESRKKNKVKTDNATYASDAESAVNTISAEVETAEDSDVDNQRKVSDKNKVFKKFK